MGGPNLEVFKFGMYIMFPIGIMYYFGTNLDSRFSTPDFWPKAGQTHTIPFERDEIKEELERLKSRRLAARAHRLAIEGQDGAGIGGVGGELDSSDARREIRPQNLDVSEGVPVQRSEKPQKSWLGLFGR